ncbi:MAG: hypothetical protein U9532_04045 ['Conium maculatum' witches'-broom phytoplasma]|nr:hypothetical protein ['Conium maculatum' witches'-broom phytoplasma]
MRKNLAYKEEKDANGNILKKTYKDGVIEEFDEKGLLKSVYYPDGKIKCLFKDNKLQFQPLDD